MTACWSVFWFQMLVLQHVWVFLGVKMLVLQHVWVFFDSTGWFYSMFGPFLGENVGFTACLGVFGVLMLVLQHVWMFFEMKLLV